MSNIVICAIAFDAKSHRYDSYKPTPEVTDFIESVVPEKALTFGENGKYAVIDTTAGEREVTASKEAVIVPTGGVAQFSYWIVKPGPDSGYIELAERPLTFEQGEHGLVGLWFGVPVRPRVEWPMYDPKRFDWFVAMMIRRFPGWQPDLPWLREVRQHRPGARL